MGSGSARGRALGVAALLVVLLAGCGWHLRGSFHLPDAITPVAVDGGGVGNRLQRLLRADNALATGRDDAASRVVILSQGRDRRVRSVDRNGKADAYALRYRVRWKLVSASEEDDDGRHVLLAPQTMRATRDYDYDSSAVLSRSDQEKAYMKAMRKDVAQRILFRLQGSEVTE